jgi:hypothetical protein
MPSSHVVLDQVDIVVDAERAVARPGCRCRPSSQSG